MSHGSYSRGGTWGCLGSIFFSKHGRVAYQIEGDDDRTGYKLNFHRMVKLVIFFLVVNRSIIIKFLEKVGC